MLNKDAFASEESLTASVARPRRLRVAEEAAAILADQILNGSHAQGDRLAEIPTAAALGVSRNTVREAFRILGNEGLVKIEPHRGVRVARLKREDVREVFCVRRALELRAIEESPEAPPECLAHLRQALDVIAHVVEGGSWYEQASADEQFHRRLVALIGSSMLDNMYGQISSLSQLLMLFAYQLDANSIFVDGLAWVDEHRELYDLVAEGRIPEAKAHLERLLAQNEAYALALIEADEEGSDGSHEKRSAARRTT